MKTVFAYLIVFFLGPLIGSIAGVILMPLFLPLSRVLKYFPIGNFVIGFATVWLSSIIFHWFGIKPTLLMIITLGVGFAFNSFNRLKHANEEQFPIELSFSIGEIAGVVIGGFYIL
ncbi:MAG: hypothetical protein V2A69_11460 [Pseudomonadota bacterium]